MVFWKKKKHSQFSLPYYVSRSTANHQFSEVLDSWITNYKSWEKIPEDKSIFPLSRILVLTEPSQAGKTTFLEQEAKGLIDQSKYKDITWVYVSFKDNSQLIDKAHALVNMRNALNRSSIRTAIFDYALTRCHALNSNIPDLNTSKPVTPAAFVVDLLNLAGSAATVASTGIAAAEEVANVLTTLASAAPGLLLTGHATSTLWEKIRDRRKVNLKHYIDTQSLGSIYSFLELFLLFDIINSDKRICLVLDDCDQLDSTETSRLFTPEPWYVTFAKLSHSLVVFSGTTNPFPQQSDSDSWIRFLTLDALSKKDIIHITRTCSIPWSYVAHVRAYAKQLPGILQFGRIEVSHQLGMSQHEIINFFIQEIKTARSSYTQDKSDEILKAFLRFVLRHLSSPKRNLIKQLAWFPSVTWNQTLRLLPAAMSDYTLLYEMVTERIYIEQDKQNDNRFYCNTTIATLIRESSSDEEVNAMMLHLKHM